MTDFRDTPIELTAVDRGGAIHNAKAYATVQAALTAIDTAAAVYSLTPGVTRTLTAITTIPVNVATLGQMGVIALNGFNLTIQGAFSAGNYQVFDPTGGGTVIFDPGTVERINARWFGLAAGNTPAANDAALAAWQACITASGGSGYVPLGTYQYLTGLVWTTGVLLEGDGKRVSVLQYTGTAGDGMTFEADSATLRNIRVTGPGKAGNTARGVVLDDSTSNGPKDVTLDDVDIRTFSVGLVDNGFATRQQKLRIESCGEGINTANQGGHSSPGGCWINDCDVGVRFTGDVTHYAMYDCNIERCVTGMTAQGSGAAPKTLFLSNVHFELNSSRDIDMGPGVIDAEFVACRFGGLNSHSNQSIRHQGALGANDVFHVRLRGCRFIDDGTHANTEIISVGPNVELIIDAPDGNMPGCPRSAITLVNTTVANASTLVLPGFLGRRYDAAGVTGAVTPDVKNGGLQILGLTGNVTLSVPTGIVTGHEYVFIFGQDATGGRTITFSGLWLGNESIVFNTAASKNTMTKWIAISATQLALVGWSAQA